MGSVRRIRMERNYCDVCLPLGRAKRGDPEVIETPIRHAAQAWHSVASLAEAWILVTDMFRHQFGTRSQTVGEHTRNISKSGV